MKLSAQLLALLFKEQGKHDLRLTNLENKMATFNDDVTRLTADNADQGAAIDALTAKETTDAAQIAADEAKIVDLQKQIADLQATGADTAALEVQLAIMEANTARLKALAPVVPPTPTV